MKVGDLVMGWQPKSPDPDCQKVGIIIEIIEDIEVPPVCKVLWDDGDIEKEWTDDVEVVNEGWRSS
jgi:hypothetical protein